ncbi:hypothetical protein ASPWEDRAFT_139763 [Aspergillus wentii DTO 134E9]|uniref:Cell division control protein 73 C-terminal domain-containing protein n=1 Tax=Aspergillus wentii DTO 134E9 TaxID=1073089 RepID=A0A1L9RB69_ASPWE|nr:uncharacterized protein ASPWEDRAFT_139763 [Aspergillus wentii DTO 134E9]KAI9934738.1 accessory factor associated with RNA polymerase II [Aspergillus wentii]OJJ32164.1 hypothetical protein ASPWEDRAFT_139763 [Aspergillus wentii DTO 134E9]
MASVDPSLQDPLLSLRRAIAAGNLPTPTTSSELSDQNATDDLAKASHLYFVHPIPQTIALTAPTRFVSVSSDSAVDLRSIFFAWQKKDVAIPEYIASAQELNESLKQKEHKEGEAEEKVQNLVFVERLDLITWLEGASDESEYIKPLEGAAAAAAVAATTSPAEASAIIASGATGGVSSVPSGAAGAAAPAAGAQQGKAPKVIDPRLQEIYNGERKMGDRNSVLRGIKPTDFSHVRKTAETFLGRHRSRTGQYPPGSKPGSKQPLVPAPSAGLPVPKKSSSNIEPIILLSPSASSLIRLSNVKSFLEDGVFVPPDHPTLSNTTSSNIMKIARPMRVNGATASSGRGVGSQNAARKTTKFILVDSTANFRPDYWQRLVAVFTTGQTWQFKSYKWSSPPELFKHATGVYVGWRGEEAPREVKGWGRGVQRFAVERWDEKGGVQGAGRWRDREVVEGIWTAIEEGMRLRGWGSK